MVTLCLLPKPCIKTAWVRYELAVFVLPSSIWVPLCVFVCFEGKHLIIWQKKCDRDRQAIQGWRCRLCCDMQLLKALLSSFSMYLRTQGLCHSCLWFMIHWLEQVRGCLPTCSKDPPCTQTCTQKNTWLWLTSPLAIFRSSLDQRQKVHWDTLHLLLCTPLRIVLSTQMFKWWSVAATLCSIHNGKLEIPSC